MLPYYRGFFAHLLILEYPNHHQNLISSSLYYPGPRPKISSQSVHNFLSNVVHKQTNKQTNQRHQKHNLLCQGGNEGASISRPLVVHLVLGGIFFFKSDRKILNDGHFKIFAAAYTEQGGHAGNNPEPLGVAFHHIGPTFIMHILFQGIPAQPRPYIH